LCVLLLRAGAGHETRGARAGSLGHTHGDAFAGQGSQRTGDALIQTKSSSGLKGYWLTRTAPIWPLQDIRSLQSFLALVNHPFIVPSICIAHTIAILVHDECAIYAPHPTPLVYAIYHTILAVAISCKAQAPIRIPSWEVRAHPNIYSLSVCACTEYVYRRGGGGGGLRHQRVGRTGQTALLVFFLFYPHGDAFAGQGSKRTGEI